MRKIKKKKAAQRFKVSALETYASIAANLVTALAGTGAFCLYLWTVHVNYIKERDPQFTANWTTFAEGCIDCPVDDNTEIIKLNLNVSDGDIAGEIYIGDAFGEETLKNKRQKSKEALLAGLAKSYTNWFMVEGEMAFYTGTIRLFDYRGGKKQFFGEAEIKLKNGFLYLQTTERAYDTIPLKAVFSPEIESAPHK